MGQQLRLYEGKCSISSNFFIPIHSIFPPTQVILQRNVLKSEDDGSMKKIIKGSESKRATLLKGSSTDEEVIEEKRRKKRVREEFIKSQRIIPPSPNLSGVIFT